MIHKTEYYPIQKQTKIFFSLIFLSIFSFNFDLVFAAVEAPKNPNSAKGCAICHFRWIDTFYIEGKGSDLVDYQSEKVVASYELCFSCHDGSVDDSRARINFGHQHKIKVPPPPDMKIPKIFPLDPEGKIQCSTCHTAHGVPSDGGEEVTMFMRTSNKNSNMCKMCHKNLDGGIDAGHHPLNLPVKNVPEKLVDGWSRFHDKDKIICESCHNPHGSENEKFLIAGIRDSGLCIECHKDKNSIDEKGKKNSVHVINSIPQKVKIPSNIIKNGALTGLKGEIICLTCHKVHNNKLKKLLLFEKDEKSTFCFLCHKDKDYLGKSKHNMAISSPSEKNLEGKTAEQSGICSACHLPHKPARKMPVDETDFTAGLCLSCHAKGQVAQKKNIDGGSHPLGIYPFNNQIKDTSLRIMDVNIDDLQLPLFDNKGVKALNGKITCITCHDPHGEPSVAAEKSFPVKNNNDKLTKSFLRRSSPNICKECHNNKFAIANTVHDISKNSPNEKNLLGQNPSEAGICGTCHLVHKSREKFIWAKPVDQTATYVSDVDRFCFSCHNIKGVAGKKIIPGKSHPLNIIPLEKGIKTKLPLYNSGMHISKDGKMTCQTCHNPHQPGSDFDKNKYGSNSKSFLRRHSSFICSECHNEKYIIMNSKHDITKIFPERKNIRNQTALETGICGPCHTPHNSGNILLWAQELTTTSGNIVENLCYSCHSKNGMAKDKVLAGSSHPLYISPEERNLKTSLPLFDNTLNKIGKNGIITCLTCHNPHRWDPENINTEKTFKDEGDNKNSFLNISNDPSPRLCENCHPDKIYLEKTDHDLRVIASSSKNIIGQTPEKSGVCGSCHLVHYNNGQIRLWAQNPGPGDTIMEKLCNSCHQKNGCAGNKVPPVSSHPNAKIVNLGKNIKNRSNYFPLFSSDTGELVTTGNITCPSCHNAHQWSPGLQTKGDGKNIEGTASNSFLRLKAQDLLCKDCHGIDSLFRFKYFHKVRKTTKETSEKIEKILGTN